MNTALQDYAERHQSALNRLIHLIAVPLFILGHVGLLIALPKLHLVRIFMSVVAILISLALQGKGHKLERVPPQPFNGPLDFVIRIYKEQFWTFPKFALAHFKV